MNAPTRMIWGMSEWSGGGGAGNLNNVNGGHDPFNNPFIGHSSLIYDMDASNSDLDDDTYIGNSIDGNSDIANPARLLQLAVLKQEFENSSGVLWQNV